MGASPPKGTLPTYIWRVFRRGSGRESFKVLASFFLIQVIKKINFLLYFHDREETKGCQGKGELTVDQFSD